MESRVPPPPPPPPPPPAVSSLSKSKSCSTTTTVTTDDDHNLSNNTSISNSSFPLSPPSCDRKSMDDLWNDINLASLNQPSPAAARIFRGGPPPTLQDFLAGPALQIDPPHGPSTRDAAAAAASADCFCSLRPPALTLLSLSSSGSGLQYRDSSSSDPDRITTTAGARVPPAPSIVTSLGSPNGPFLYKRKAEEEAAEDDGEERRRRLMKNRESASRSRAKKQAYMDELEVEVAHLQKENAKLRLKSLEMKLALPAAALLPKKTSLRRTLTAPF